MWTPTQIWHRFVDRLTTPAPALAPAVPCPSTDPLDGLIFRPDPDVVARPAGDELFLVHLTRGHVFRLNRTGKAVWALLDSAPSADQIVSSVSAAYGESAERVAEDVHGLLRQLRDQSLLEVSPEARWCAVSSNCP